MAVSVVLSEIQQDTLRKLCDTYVPSLEGDAFRQRCASDLGVPEAVEQALSELPEDQLDGLRELLDALAGEGFNAAPVDVRTQIIHAFDDSGPEALAGMSAFKGLALMLFYGLPDEQGRNPNWDAIGYPGPVSAPPDTPKTIPLVQTSGDELTLHADAVVVGSGAGGGVAAGTLAGAGKQVVVLEMGGYHNESDFNQLELWAYENLYRGGGLTRTDEGLVALMAGTGLGGGTVVNWTNCLRTTDEVRHNWETQHGLEGLTGADYDAHLDAVWERLGVNDQCSDYNGPQERLKDGCDALGYDFTRITRNSDPEAYDPETAGFMGFGDQSGAKQSTFKTFLQDAADAGAQTVTHCRVERVLVENGRAAGVEGFVVSDTGERTRVVVRAPQVVVAGGALETPALLLRSDIGGPATGEYLRLHPATGLIGVYPEEQKAWWGPPQSGLTKHFSDVEDGHGFLIECSMIMPGLGAASIPWEDGARHKDLMAEGRQQAAFVMLIRDRGSGRVSIDSNGEAVHHYAFSDPLDQRVYRRGVQELARLHAAAGAEAMVPYMRKLRPWRKGDDPEAFAQRLHDAPIEAFEQGIFALHQMGSARMGDNSRSSVANPWGELHDTPGVWIGDASAFPTASGTNPMITVMALARRTATAMLAAS